MIDRLKQLKLKLYAAYKNQQYHLLTGLDDEIRQCVQDTVAQAKQMPAEIALVSQELKELMVLYSKVVSRCEEKSYKLKQEYTQTKNNKQSAGKYLDIATQFS